LLQLKLPHREECWLIAGTRGKLLVLCPCLAW